MPHDGVQPGEFQSASDEVALGAILAVEEGVQWLQVETSPDGAIVLRPAVVPPIELCDDARIAAFLAEDALSPDLGARLRAALNDAQHT